MHLFHPLPALLLAGLFVLDQTAQAEENPPPSWPSVLSSSDRQRLESTENQLKPMLNEHQQSADEETRNEALNVYRILLEAPEPLAEANLTGNWKCRSIQIDAESIFGYPNFKCAVRKTADGLFLEKVSGSQRISGYLLRQDDSHLVFAGGSTVNDEPQVSYSALEHAPPRESDTVALVRSTPDGFVLLIPEQEQYYNVVRFSR